MSQASEMPLWKGLFDWSIKFQDGTHPANFSQEQFTPERRAWLEAALKHYMHDFVDRMTQIKRSLDVATGGSDAGGKDQAQHTVAEQEALLEELMDIVSSIDYARDLHKIGGLQTLTELLSSPHDSLRWRAAEVMATCMANNPPVQQWFLEGGVLPPLLSLLRSDPDVTTRSKALLALSAMVRHDDICLQAFLSAGGATSLVEAIHERLDARLVRKAMLLLQYVMATQPIGCQDQSKVVTAVGAVLSDSNINGLGSHDASSSGGQGTDLRQAALTLLVELVSTPNGWRSLKEAGVPSTSEGTSGGPTTSALTAVVQQLLERHGALPADLQDAEKEEGQLCAHLMQLLQGSGPAESRQSGGAGGDSSANGVGTKAAATQPPVLLLTGP